MKYLILFFTWLKSALAKEILLTVLGILIALVLSFITNTVLEYSAKDGTATLQSELRSMGIGKLKYWIYLFMFFMLMVYAVRLVEAVIKTVLTTKPQKQ